MKVGDKVKKISGDYSLEGIVVAVFFTTSGKKRIVVEALVPKGLLHIYNETQLELI